MKTDKQDSSVFEKDGEPKHEELEAIERELAEFDQNFTNYSEYASPLYERTMRNHPVFPEEQLRELFFKLRQSSDEQEREEIVDKIFKHNLGLVFFCVRQRKHMWRITAVNSFHDLVESGNEGLLKVIRERFDPTRSNKFSTYAVWYINSAIQRGSEPVAGPVRQPAYKHEQTASVRKFHSDYILKNGDEPSPDVIAKELGLSVYSVEEILGHSYGEAFSLNNTPQTLEGDGSEIIERFEDAKAMSPEVRALAKIRIEKMLEKLSSLHGVRGMDIFFSVYFSNGIAHKRTYEDVGKEFNTSKQMVQQTVKRIWKFVRKKNKDEFVQSEETFIAFFENLEYLAELLGIEIRLPKQNEELEVCREIKLPLIKMEKEVVVK